MLTKDCSGSGAVVEKKESTKAGEPDEVNPEQDVCSKQAEGEKDKEQKGSLADKETKPMLQPGFLQPKLSKGQKKRMKEKAKKKQQAAALEKEETFWNEMAVWAKAENAAATTSDKGLESKETPSMEAEPLSADSQAELISLMTEVYLEVDPDAIQANAEMESIQHGRIVEPDDADLEESSEFCLRPKSSEQDSEFLDKKMQEYLEHVRRQDTAPLELTSNDYPVNSVGAYLQEIMVTMSADSFWKDLMIPIETAISILQKSPDEAARKKASALIAETRDNCGNIHLFQDEQRIMGAVVKLLGKSDTSLHTVVPAEEFRKVKAAKGMDAMKQYSAKDLEKLRK